MKLDSLYFIYVSKACIFDLKRFHFKLFNHNLKMIS